MTAIVIGQTFVLVLVGALLAGLLRSFGELLERVDRLEAARAAGAGPARSGSELAPGLPPVPERDLPTSTDISGKTLTGDAVHLALGTGGGPDTLLAFLSSGCLTCKGFWDALSSPDECARLPGDVRVVAVTKGLHEESPTKLLELSGPALTTVASSEAWEAYEVPGSPYFVFVDGATGSVRGEGAGVSFDQVVSLMTDAVYDAELERAGGDAAAVAVRGESNIDRERRADAALAAAGVSHDDASLYDDSSWTAGAEVDGVR